MTPLLIMPGLSKSLLTSHVYAGNGERSQRKFAVLRKRKADHIGINFYYSHLEVRANNFLIEKHEHISLMNTNLTFKFDFKTDSTDCAYSLMSLILEKLKSLQSVCEDLKYVEVNLFAPEDPNEETKTALFKVISNDNNIAEYSRSKRWEDAFLNAFDKVRDNIIAR